MITRECQFCGKKFNIYERSQFPRKYCCEECSASAREIKVKEYRLKKRKSPIVGKHKVIPAETVQVEVKVNFPSWVRKQRGAEYV